MIDVDDWMMVMAHIPAEPSRHRVAVWRELRKLGAVPAASGAWVAPSTPAFLEGLKRVEILCERGGGTLALLDVVPRGEVATALLHDAFAAARRDEWREFMDDCGKFEAEIAREIAKEKFTFGELEEEEQSLDRLQRWFGDLKERDLLALDEGEQAAQRLDASRITLENYAEMVYARVQSDSPASDIVPSLGGSDD